MEELVIAAAYWALQEFCESGDLDVYDRLPQKVKDQLIKGSFQLLFQGDGNLELARNILMNEGLIQILIDKVIGFIAG